MKLYFVKGERNGWCVCAGHYLATSPKEAIRLFTEAQDRNPHTAKDWKADLTLTARKSNADARSMAMNQHGDA